MLNNLEFSKTLLTGSLNERATDVAFEILHDPRTQGLITTDQLSYAFRAGALYALNFFNDNQKNQ